MKPLAASGLSQSGCGLTGTRPPAPGVSDPERVGSARLTAWCDYRRVLALALARHTIHNIQPDLDILKGGRPNYSTTPDSLTAAAHVVAIEFQTIAAANNYWRS
ncbi:hexameric tyrosine-coordinated heme protein [Streptomyces sp. NPDC059893]|uniref:hexameric tyrosine-coordinated heme protein n=1 Tax=Streptomyces sp. NPDC059893 TaxID=3346990 RepID=UPI0036525B35